MSPLPRFLLGAAFPMLCAAWYLTDVAPGQARDQQARMPPRARVCAAKSRPANAAAPESWAITVSSEGGWCPHMTEFGSEDQIQAIARPPAHGELVQVAQGPKTVILYKPSRGYTGGDGFTLRDPRRGLDMPYSVSVIP